MIRVAIAEDHTLIRQSLGHTLERHAGLQLVADAAIGPGMLELVRRTRPDVVVVGVDLAEQDAFALISALAAEVPAPRVLALSICLDDNAAHRGLRAGAAGWIGRTTGAEDLIAAIRAVHEGRLVVPPDGAPDPAEVLSPRERQVLGYLAQGMTNREIAERLAISVKTIDTHRGHVLKKLKLRNNADLTRFAIAHGYVSM